MTKRLQLTGVQRLERSLIVDQFATVSRYFFNDAYTKGYHVREALRFLKQRAKAGDTSDQAIGRLEDWAWEREETAELRSGPTALGLNPIQG